MNISKFFWNKRAKGYDQQVNKTFAHAYSETIRLSKEHLQSDDVVLDFACGTGLTTLELSKSVKKLYAIDMADKMIEIAKSKADAEQIKNIEFKTTDIFDESLEDKKFDVILAHNILYFLKNFDEVMNRINALLKFDGVFISATDCLGEKKSLKITIMTWLSKLGIIPYMRCFSVSSLKKEIQKRGFEIQSSQNLNDKPIPPNYYIVAIKTYSNE